MNGNNQRKYIKGIIIILLIFVYQPAIFSNVVIGMDSGRNGIIGGVKSESGDHVLKRDTVALGLDQVLDAIFEKKKKEFAEMVLRNERIKRGEIDASPNYSFSFDFDEEFLEYVKYYELKENEPIEKQITDEDYISINVSIKD